MMICGFYRATVRHNNQRALVKPRLFKWGFNCLSDLLFAIPCHHQITITQVYNPNRPIWSINKGTRSRAFTDPVRGHKASFAVGRASLKKLKMPWVQMARTWAIIGEHGVQLAAGFAAGLLFKQGQQLPFLRGSQRVLH